MIDPQNDEEQMLQVEVKTQAIHALVAHRRYAVVSGLNEPLIALSLVQDSSKISYFSQVMSRRPYQHSQRNSQ
jgi:hypothetical protein